MNEHGDPDIGGPGPESPPDPSELDKIEAQAVTLDTTGDPPPRREWLAGDDSMGWLPAGRLAMLTGREARGSPALRFNSRRQSPGRVPGACCRPPVPPTARTKTRDPWRPSTAPGKRP